MIKTNSKHYQTHKEYKLLDIFNGILLSMTKSKNKGSRAKKWHLLKGVKILSKANEWKDFQNLAN